VIHDQLGRSGFSDVLGADSSVTKVSNGSFYSASRSRSISSRRRMVLPSGSTRPCSTSSGLRCPLSRVTESQSRHRPNCLHSALVGKVRFYSVIRTGVPAKRVVVSNQPVWRFRDRLRHVFSRPEAPFLTTTLSRPASARPFSGSAHAATCAQGRGDHLLLCSIREVLDH
jgi:hypothetical protein